VRGEALLLRKEGTNYRSKHVFILKRRIGTMPRGGGRLKTAEVEKDQLPSQKKSHHASGKKLIHRYGPSYGIEKIN